ncbi:MAG: hypothetical protein IPK82_26275 [Polyangiaceae bacterium]|nr:hypothetical protein [Polyangiaceae bacterium]
MSDIVYAVHTRSCTYLLDDEGICRWVLSRSGARTDDRCVGAQFVAALDLRENGGLVGELRIGASALFIRHEDGRFALIRTKPIEHVEMRGAEGTQEPQQELPDYPPHYDLPPEPPPPRRRKRQPRHESDPDVVLPSHHAVAGVFQAPSPAPEPSPPSEQRVIVQSAYSMTGYDEAPAPYVPPPPAPLPPAPLPMPPRRAEPMPRGHTEPPPPPAPPPVVTRPPLPIAPPRVPAARPSRSDSQETQPLPLAPSPSPPTGRVPAWPPMLAPPPPQAELLPLGPARPDLPSAEELDVDDLEEVAGDEQIYSTEVTVSLPLFRPPPYLKTPPK